MSIPVGLDDTQSWIKGFESRLSVLERSSQLFGNLGGGQRVVGIPNADTVPTTPFSGVILYTEGGVLKFMKSTGTVVAIT